VVGSPCLYAPARVTPEKGQADVIRVSGILRRRGLPTTVLLAGRIDSTAYENELRRMAREQGLSDSVTFLGSLSSEEVRDWYQAASLMLLPTRHVEGLPRSILECQAMAVPPIAYEAGGVREGIREGETGFVVTPGDVEGLANRAEMLLRDGQRRRAMGEAGRAFVTANFSLAALAERHAAFYRAAVP
jgi:phosphatidylinositol alpha-1,6-mannosyltransferase